MAITLTTLPSQPATFFKPQALKSSTISPPKVSPTAPTESSLLLTLLIYRFGIFRDRWALFLRRSPTDPTGILLHMRDDGDGQFRFEIKRNYDTRMAAAPHPAMIDLAWVGKENFGDDNEENMWKKGVYFVERPGVPTCRFEEVIARAGGEGFMGSVYAQVSCYCKSFSW